jgi:hypothetical protein
MDLLLAPIVELYRTIQTPIAPFTWFGLPLSTLDIAGTVRLCVIMRQLKEMMRADHERKRLAARRALKGKDKAREAGVVSSYDDEGDAGDDVLSLASMMPRAQEERSFVRDALGTLLVVYGGEIVCGMPDYFHRAVDFILNPYQQPHSSAKSRPSCTRAWFPFSSSSPKRPSKGCPLSL